MILIVKPNFISKWHLSTGKTIPQPPRNAKKNELTPQKIIQMFKIIDIKK